MLDDIQNRNSILLLFKYRNKPYSIIEYSSKPLDELVRDFQIDSLGKINELLDRKRNEIEEKIPYTSLDIKEILFMKFVKEDVCGGKEMKGYKLRFDIRKRRGTKRLGYDKHLTKLS